MMERTDRKQKIRKKKRSFGTFSCLIAVCCCLLSLFPFKGVVDSSNANAVCHPATLSLQLATVGWLATLANNADEVIGNVVRVR